MYTTRTFFNTGLAEKITPIAVAPQNRRGRILDVSPHDVDVLLKFAHTWNCDPYAVEPSERVHELRERGIMAVRGKFLSVRISKSSMSAVIGTIPTDHDSMILRAHSLFVARIAEVLAPGGIAILAGPPEVFDLGVCTVLMRMFVPYAFICSGWVLIIGIRREYAVFGQHPGELEKAIKTGAIPEFDPAAIPPVTLPAVPPRITFAPSEPYYGDIIAEEMEHGVWTRAEFEHILLRPPDTMVRPVMPLRKGHLALLIAGGMFDNLVIRTGRKRYLIKGRTSKTKDLLEKGTSRTVEAEKFRVLVSVLDLDDAKFSILTDD